MLGSLLAKQKNPSASCYTSPTLRERSDPHAAKEWTPSESYLQDPGLTDEKGSPGSWVSDLGDSSTEEPKMRCSTCRHVECSLTLSHRRCPPNDLRMEPTTCWERPTAALTDSSRSARASWGRPWKSTVLAAQRIPWWRYYQRKLDQISSCWFDLPPRQRHELAV